MSVIIKTAANERPKKKKPWGLTWLDDHLTAASHILYKELKPS